MPCLVLLAVALAAKPTSQRSGLFGRKPPPPRRPPWRAVKPHLVLYVLTSVNTAAAVFTNDYKRVPWAMRKHAAPHLIYSRLFYFARLRPRVVFVIGAMLRALQLTTPLQHVFDPAVGCGAGLNMLALFAGSRWPAPVVLGWAVTRHFWRLLGAQRPPPVRVPIEVILADTF